MKHILQIVLLMLLPVLSWAQLHNVDSLKAVLANAPDGPLRFKAASNVYFFYQELNRDSALYYADQELQIARHSHHKIAEGVSLGNMAYQLSGLGNFGGALKCLQEAFPIATDIQNENEQPWELFPTPFTGNNRLLLLSFVHHMYGLLMLNTENTEQQIYHFKEAARIAKEINYFPRIMLANLNLGQCYLQINKTDSALYFEKEAERLVLQTDEKAYYAKTFTGTVQVRLGDLYRAMGDRQQELVYYYKSLQSATQNNSKITVSRACVRLARYYIDAGNKDSALYYSLKNLDVLQTLGSVATFEINLGLGYESVYRSYHLNQQFDSAYKYQGLALRTNDSLHAIRIKNLAEFQKLTYNEQLRLQELEKEKEVYQNKIRTWFLLTGMAGLLLMAVIFYRNYRQKQKANIKIARAYDNLKATQQQLIQAEKMASLGELTAGIAHEIQNPLNFVNNFSEVSNELMDEMKIEFRNGNGFDAFDIADEIQRNLEKINLHGKRADAIVKGMLQHSRTSTSQQEPTDINKLADEYLRLAYHGLQAKDTIFNATLKTDFDASIGKMNIIPQDIGKVMLNIFTNAFYAVNEKSRFKNLTSPYEPVVTVTTKKAAGKVLITVSDNGNGISPNIMHKIFQPFFTTKPTGQGTGLGLSLAYDIVKAHGGEIKVQSNENDGTVFTIQLPAV